jgi:hypothetical protein
LVRPLTPPAVLSLVHHPLKPHDVFSLVHHHLNLKNILCVVSSHAWNFSPFCALGKYEPTFFSDPCPRLFPLNLNSQASDVSYSLTCGGDVSCAFSSLSFLLFVFSQLQPK